MGIHVDLVIALRWKKKKTTALISHCVSVTSLRSLLEATSSWKRLQINRDRFLSFFKGFVVTSHTPIVVDRWLDEDEIVDRCLFLVWSDRYRPLRHKLR